MTISRRSLLGGATGAAALAGLGVHAASSASASPARAADVGMNRLVFSDEFDSLDTIDLDKTGARGFKWYSRAPWNLASGGRGDYQVMWENGTSFLRITPSVNNKNWAISTMDPRTGNGSSFQFGYFEARMRFNPPAEPDWDSGNYPFAWPSMWGVSDDDLRGRASGNTVELDVIEACQGNGWHIGTLHDFRDGTRWSGGNAVHNTGADFRQWHTYAARWTDAGVSWYFDDQWLMTQYYGGQNGPVPQARLNYKTTSTPSPWDCFTQMNRVHMVFALGSGIGAPMDIDWVRFWQA